MHDLVVYGKKIWCTNHLPFKNNSSTTRKLLARRATAPGAPTAISVLTATRPPNLTNVIPLQPDLTNVIHLHTTVIHLHNVSINDSILSIQNHNRESNGGGDGGGGGRDGGGGAGGGGGGGAGGGGGDSEEKNFGAPMKFEQAAEEKGVELSADKLTKAIVAAGLAKFICVRVITHFSKTLIDGICAKFAELQKRGKDLLGEFALRLRPRIGKPSVALAIGGVEKSTSSLKCEKQGCACSTKQLQASEGALGFLITMIFDKMLHGGMRFLAGTGIKRLIDLYCPTFAEIQKWRKYFWDKLMSCAVDVLVGMLAPYARTGNRSVASGLNNSVAALPSSDERHQLLTTYIEQMSSFYNHTDPMASFSLGGISQRDISDSLHISASDERHLRLTTYIEQMSSFYNHTDPMATFSLGGTSQRDISDSLHTSASDERHQRLTTYIEQMSSFYNRTDPIASFSLGGTSQRDERVTMVRENEVLRVTRWKR